MVTVISINLSVKYFAGINENILKCSVVQNENSSVKMRIAV